MQEIFFPWVNLRSAIPSHPRLVSHKLNHGVAAYSGTQKQTKAVVYCLLADEVLEVKVSIPSNRLRYWL
jgi:hypothetical protein